MGRLVCLSGCVSDRSGWLVGHWECHHGVCVCVGT